MAKKAGRPRSQPPRLRKCPRCGKLGWPVVKRHKRKLKDGVRIYTYRCFSHYDRSKFEAREPTHTKICHISKKKTMAEGPA